MPQYVKGALQESINIMKNNSSCIALTVIDNHNHSAGKHDRGPFFRLIRSRLTGSI